MKRFFKWLLVLFAALMAGVAVLLYNPGLFKGPLERLVSNASGYSISFDGELEIDAGRLLRITATDIRVAAPEWATRRDLASAGSVQVSLETASIFADHMVIDSLQTTDLQVNLETDNDGSGNWSNPDAPPPAASDGNRDPFVFINSIQLKNVDVRFLSAESGIEQHFNLVSLDQKQLPDGMLQAMLKGSLNGRPVAFEGSFGPYANLLKGRDISYQGNGHFGNLRLNGSGVIDDLLQPRYPQFHLNMQGPSIDEITAMFGVNDLGSGEFSLLARGERVNNRYEAGVDGKIGNISLGLTARASDLTGLDELDLKFTANGPSLDAVMRLFGVKHWPDQPFSIKSDIERIGSTLNISRLTLAIGGTEMVLDALLTKFPDLDASRVRLSIQGDDVEQFRGLLGIGGVASGPFKVKGSLDVNPQEVELLQLEFQTSLGRMVISGTLGDAPDYSGSKLHLHLDGNNAHTLMSIFDLDLMPEAAFSLDSQIESTDSGLIIERAVLVTEDNERLELDGFVSFESGSLGTDVSVQINSKHLQRLLGRLNTGIEVPDLPYQASGKVRILEQGVRLDGVKAAFADIQLGVDGLLVPRDQLMGTGLDIGIEGRDISTLGRISALEDVVSRFVPGQSYGANGRLLIVGDGLKLEQVRGHIGETAVEFDGLIDNRSAGGGITVRFSIKSPDLHGLVSSDVEIDLPEGAFESSAGITILHDSISVEDFRFATAESNGKLNLELGLPLDKSSDIKFDLDAQGKDIRNVLPRTDFFEPAKSVFNIKTVGQKRGNVISLQQLDAKVGELRIFAEGRVDDGPDNESVDITFSAAASDLSGLGRINGMPLPEAGLNLKADFSGNASQFVLSNLVGSLGDSDVSGSIDVSLKGSKPKIDLTAESSYIDIRPYLEPDRESAEEPAGEKKKRLIPDDPFPLEALDAADITAQVSIDELRHQNDSIRNMVLTASVVDGSLEIPQLTMRGERGNLVSSLSVRPTGKNQAAVNVDLSTEKMVLNLLGQPPDRLSELPAFDIDFHVNGTGSNLQELAGRLDGTFSMVSDGGSLEGVSLGVLDWFVIEEIFNLIMPKSNGDDALKISCIASAFEIADGLVKTAPAITYTTDKLSMVAKGTLDLKTEKVHLNFNATPTKAINVSAGELFNPYIQITGTLAEPAVGLDASKAVLHGGAAVGTAGISILAKGLFDRMSNTAAMCEEIKEKARQGRK